MTDENVRVVSGTQAAEIAYLEQQGRTPQQKQMDATFDHAQETAVMALEAAEDSLAWMGTMGDVPSQFRNMPVLLGQWKAWISEQRRIKQ